MYKAISIFLLLLCTNTHLFAQGGFRGSNHTFSVQNNEIWIYQTAYFSQWDDSSCPRIDLLSIARSGNIKRVDVYYDLRVGGPFYGCARQDTIHDTVSSCNPCTLAVNTFIIRDYPIMNDTTFADTDTSLFSVLSLDENFIEEALKIYPNPTSDILHIKTPEARTSLVLQVINSRGERVFEKALPREEISEINVQLPPGLYQCLLQNEFGKIEAVRKLMIVR